MVTVVDCANLLTDYSSSDFLADRGETAGEGDSRTLVDLLVEQIESFRTATGRKPHSRQVCAAMVWWHPWRWTGR